MKKTESEQGRALGSGAASRMGGVGDLSPSLGRRLRLRAAFRGGRVLDVGGAERRARRARAELWGGASRRGRA